MMLQTANALGLVAREWDMPGLGFMWQFTTEEGITFYTRAGASRAEVEERLEEKRAQFEEAA